MSIEEIEGRLTSEDPEILRDCLRFIDERLSDEAERRRAAEGRATAVLGLAGAAVALLVHYAGSVNADGLSWTPKVVVFAALLFLAKSSYFALRALAALRGYSLTEDLVYEKQGLPVVEALRRELAAKIGVYRWSSQPNTYRLFALDRSQRNLFVAILFILVAGGLATLDESAAKTIPDCAALILALAAIVVLTVGDPLAERLGIWDSE